MTHFRAAVGLLAVASVVPQVSQNTSGNWLRQTTTTTVTGTSRIDWLVALPALAQPQAVPVAMCVVATPCLDAACTRRQPCPDPSLVATSRAAFDAWGSGNLPATPETVYSWTSSQSSWGPLALVLGGELALTLVGVDPVWVGAAGQLLAGSGGSPVPMLTPYGGLPSLSQVDDGYRLPPAAPSSQQQAMNLALGSRTTAAQQSAGELSALRDAASGALPAPGSAGAGNSAQWLAAWSAQLRACAGQGLTGDALAQCAGMSLQW